LPGLADKVAAGVTVAALKMRVSRWRMRVRDAVATRVSNRQKRNKRPGVAARRHCRLPF
jgi:hypothetical protein